MVSVDQVLSTLGTVIDPDLKKDIVSMGMIKDRSEERRVGKECRL